MDITDRQQKLLKLIITEFVKTAQPVGSKLISGKRGFDLSSATIRNEMAVLEQAGFIAQPHTSSGRVPTALGYRYYIDNLLDKSELSEKDQQDFSKTLKEISDNTDIKSVAKAIAEHATNAVFVLIDETSHYYTGLSYLFAQPEFERHQLVQQIGNVLDHLDGSLQYLRGVAKDEVSILVGPDNPFGDACSTLAISYSATDHKGILGLLGPMRMDYQKNYSLLTHSRQLVENA